MSLDIFFDYEKKKLQEKAASQKDTTRSARPFTTIYPPI
jgi:hypothetical protein